MYHSVWFNFCLTFSFVSSALPTWLRRLPSGADAVYDEVAARPETTTQNLPCSQAAPRSHQHPTPSFSAPLCGGTRLSAASAATRTTHAPADVWCQHGQYLRLRLLPGDSSGGRGRGGGGRRLEQPTGPEPQTGPGLSQQSEKFGVWFRLLWGVMAGRWGGSQEDEERAGVLLSLPPHKQSTERTYSTQIHLWRLSGDVDIVWGQRPRGLDKLFIDQRTQPPASGSGWQQLCRPHTELDGLARLSWARSAEAESEMSAGKRFLRQHEEETGWVF